MLGRRRRSFEQEVAGERGEKFAGLKGRKKEQKRQRKRRAGWSVRGRTWRRGTGRSGALLHKRDLCVFVTGRSGQGPTWKRRNGREKKKKVTDGKKKG